MKPTLMPVAMAADLDWRLRRDRPEEQRMTYTYRGGDYRDVESLRAWLTGQAPEAVLEPDLPIIDPHHHLWDSTRGRYMLDELIADISTGHKIVATVFEECHAMYRAAGPEALRPVGEVEFVRGAAAMSASGNYGPVRIAAAMVARADLTLGSCVRPVLEAEMAAGGGMVRGIRASMPWDPHEEISRHVTHPTEPGRLADPTFREGVAQVGQLSLVLDVWIYFTQIPELTSLARALPHVRIVINHCGGPICVGPYAEKRAEYMAVWATHMRELASCPNVHVKLGGLGMLHFGFNFHLREAPPSSAELAEAWRPYIEICIEAFSAKRAMFESNFPPDKQSCTYLTLWNAFKRITSNASSDEKAMLFAGTARDVYGLD
jgi:predicted TIM-barrel fold metal-dependent hydrolase